MRVSHALHGAHWGFTPSRFQQSVATWHSYTNWHMQAHKATTSSSKYNSAKTTQSRHGNKNTRLTICTPCVLSSRSGYAPVFVASAVTIRRASLCASVVSN
eukprot:2336450-Amphidinium_carterae.1